MKALIITFLFLTSHWAQGSTESAVQDREPLADQITNQTANRDPDCNFADQLNHELKRSPMVSPEYFMDEKRSSQKTFGKAFCMTPQNKLVDDSKIQGDHFKDFASLDSKQTDLIENYLTKNGFTAYQEWSTQHNDRVSTFLSVTHALQQVDVYTDSTHFISGLDLFKSFSEVRGDRIIGVMDKPVVAAWMANKGKYKLRLSSGKVERGSVQFRGYGTQGALHCGYDVQGYSSTRHLPFLHWNYRFRDGMTDIHLDGVRPWILGFIPNPFHLTYANSDVRHWLGKYKKKFGDPGFEVTLLGSHQENR